MSLCALLIAIAAVAFMQVVFRYVVRVSLDWSEELARFLFMWLAGLGAAYAFKTRSHFALTFVVDRFPRGARRLAAHAVVLVVCVLLVVFTYQAVKYTWSVRNQIAPGMQISMAVPYSSAAVGGALMLYYVIRNWWADLARTADPYETRI
jgi:TRAP-type C4-dicarboxylate transport system permease small subunit